MIKKRCSTTVSLAAPPQQRWIPVVEKYAEDVRILVADMMEAVDEILDTSTSKWLKRLLWMVNSGLGSACLGIFRGEWIQEIRGIAKASGVPLAQLIAANLVYDLAQLSDRWMPTACSSYSFNSDTGPTLARNMDWCWPDTIGRHTKVVQMVGGVRDYYSVIVPGQVGVLSAFSPGHWAVTLNQAPAANVRLNFNYPPAMWAMREILSGADSFESLCLRAKLSRTATPFFAHCVGTESHEHAVISKIPDSYDIRYDDDLGLSQTNHYVGSLSKLNPDVTTGVDEDGEEWEYDSEERFQILAEALNYSEDPLDVLMREPIFNSGTMQTMVFNPSSGSRQVWAHER